MPTSAAIASPAILRTRTCTLLVLVALIVLCVAWELWLAPLRPGGSWLALKALPLVPALWGVARLRMFTYRWLSLLVWLYFMEGAVRGTSDPAPSSILGWIEVALSMALFALCVIHVRLRQRGGGTAAPEQTK